MADNTSYSTSRLPSDQLGFKVDEMLSNAKTSRRSFERRWYDNNFFDDGFHFRYLSRQDNRIVDLSSESTLYAPLRAIPKASRQIRGIANLLLGTEPVPVVYPQPVTSANYPPVPATDPQTGQPAVDQQTGLTIMQPNPEYEKARAEAKRIAKLVGHWITEEFKEQELIIKLAQMLILSAKHGVSYLQIWPNANGEEIRTQVFDAFDIYLDGRLSDIQDSPYLIKSLARTIADIKADPRFDPSKTAQISPDNRNASSEIKEAYMQARYQGISQPDSVSTIIEKEAFIKEYLNEYNTPRIKAQKNGGDILKQRSTGDTVIRHTFVEGNIEVLDEYIDAEHYPFVDLRYEPGPIYQVPLIERFIPANKSLDVVMSRVERYTNSMVAGIWMKRQGEQHEITNSAGGQVIEYNQTKPEQANIAPLPGFVFNYINLLQSFISEQGVTTNILAHLPPGVRSGSAIAALKASELSGLAISNTMFQNTVQRAVERFLDLADDYFVTPKTIHYMDKGEPHFFDVIGGKALEKRQSVKLSTPEDVVKLSGDYKVDITVETGKGYSQDEKMAAAEKLGNFLAQLAQVGFVDPKVIKAFLEQMLEAYGFGVTQDIVDSLDEYAAKGQLPDEQVTKMKIAMAQVLNDVQGSSIMPTQEQRLSENKLGVAQTAVDLNGNGIPDNQEGGGRG